MDMPQDGKVYSDGSTASYYELPENCKELQDLISARNMNAQIGEIFRACYRYGIAGHSSQLRDAKKMLFYAKAEVARLERLEKRHDGGNKQTSQPLDLVVSHHGSAGGAGRLGFSREERYVVLKLKDIVAALSTAQRAQLSNIETTIATHRARLAKLPLRCVVVESGWPEYETVWKMLEVNYTAKE